MHIENKLAEIVTIRDHEFEEVIEEYEEEILVQKEVLEPPLTDSANTAPAQGKPRCITSIFHTHRIYMCCAFMLQENFVETIYIYPMSSTSAGSSRCYA